MQKNVSRGKTAFVNAMLHRRKSFDLANVATAFHEFSKEGSANGPEFLGDTEPPMDLQQTKAERVRNSESV